MNNSQQINISKNSSFNEFKRNEDLFHLFSQNSGIMFYRMSLPEGIYEYVSPTSLEILGYTPEELYSIPRLIADIIHPDWKDYFKTEWNNLMEGNMPPSYEYQVIHKSGETKWLHQWNLLELNQEGKPIAIESVVTDITTHQEEEKAFHASMEKYKAFFDRANDTIFILEGEKFIDCNTKTLSMFGLDMREEIIGKTPWDFSPEFQPDGIPSRAKATLLISGISKEGTKRFHWKHNRKDNTFFDAEVSLSHLDLNNRSFIMAIVRDITAQKKYEEELHHLRNLLENIINSMPSVIIGVNPELEVTEWNREAEKISGISTMDALGKYLTDIFPMITIDMGAIREAIQEREPRSFLKIPYQRDQETRYSDITIYPLVANGVEGAVIRVDDISPRVRIEEMMIQSEKMLSVGGLATGMAHEINNPLAGILQNVQVIKNRTSGFLEKNRKAAEECGTSIETIEMYMQKRGIYPMIETIIESGQRAAQIVGNMLNFSRKSDQKFEPHDICGLLDKTVELASNDYDLKKKYDFRQIKVSREYQSGIPLIPCEPGQIQQVFLNILKNAAFAMNEKYKNIPPNPADIYEPVFTLRVFMESEMVRVEIEDNGTGMEEKIRRRIFEPFFTTKTVGHGTGLGLSISYFIITENHKGIMTVESIPEKGSKFIIRLPLKGVIR